MTECELILSFSYNRLKHYRMLSATRPKYTQRIQGYDLSSSRFKRYKRKNIKDEYVLSDMKQAWTHEWWIFNMWICSPVKQNRSAGLLENYLFYFYVCVKQISFAKWCRCPLFLLKDSFFSFSFIPLLQLFKTVKQKRTLKLLACIQYFLAPILSRLNSNFLKTKNYIY